jgi:RimJ/RimL family protein N-acetyltransferase
VRSQRRRIGFDEFRRLPRHPGWQYEYVGGEVHIQPAPAIVVTSLAVQPRCAPSTCRLRPTDARDAPALAAAFEEAFAPTVEYCDWEPDAIRASARECIESYYAGTRGVPLPVARLAVAGENVAGAALVSRGRGGPWLDMLFVRPAWQRQGLATALVAAVVTGLHAAGEARLASGYHLANDASRAWHHRFGFQDEPDLPLAERYLSHAQHERRRREQGGPLLPAERAALQAECDYWQDEVSRLQAIAQVHGYEKVCPLLRYRER